MSRRTLVFDVGGVIVRWQPGELMLQCFPGHAIDDASTERVKALVFESFHPQADWARFDLGLIEPEALAERIARRTGLPRDGLAALIAAVPAHLQPMSPSVNLLRRLRDQGHRLALLSNMPSPYAAHLEQAHECFSWFEHRAWSGRLGKMKPERAIFDHLQGELALDLDQAIFIDDHEGNVGAARALGWKALRFESAAQCERELALRGWL